MRPLSRLRDEHVFRLLVRVVGSPHFWTSSSTVMSLEAIQLPQRKVSSADAASGSISSAAMAHDVFMGDC